MKTLLITLLTFISLNLFSQNSKNRESMMAQQITEEIYQYFEGRGVERFEMNPDSCDCGFYLEYKFTCFAEESEATDWIILNEYTSDDAVIEIANVYKRDLKKYGQPLIKEVFVYTDIFQVKNKWSFIRGQRKIKYKIQLNIVYKPVNKR